MDDEPRRVLNKDTRAWIEELERRRPRAVDSPQSYRTALTLTLLWVSSARNVADVFTKALLAPAFVAFRSVILGLDRLWRYY